MIPPLKIKCKKQQYRPDGTCALFLYKTRLILGELAIKHECLKQNCIYYEGENNELR